MTTVWTRDRGFVGFDAVTRSHPEHRPSAELYFEGAWVGVHCFRRRGGRNELDEELVKALIQMADRATGTGKKLPR